jgi:zinc finger HIT domain-containing protein 3
MSISKPANEESAQEDVESAMEPPNAKPGSSNVESLTGIVAGEEAEKQKSSLAGADISKTKLCGVCNEKEWKYKCTRCYLPS